MFAELAFAFVFREVQKSSCVSDGGLLKRKPGNCVSDFNFMFYISINLDFMRFVVMLYL